jgi:hypothetical protein
MMGFNTLKEIPPTMMAKTTSKAAKTEAFLHPNTPGQSQYQSQAGDVYHGHQG